MPSLVRNQPKLKQRALPLHLLALLTSASLLDSACSADADDRVGAGRHCESLVDEGESADGSVVVTIQNLRAEPVRLLAGPLSPHQGLVNPVRVSSYFPTADGEMPVVPVGVWPGENCTTTCQDYQNGECTCVGSAIRLAPVFLAPGGEYLAEWPGILRVPDRNPLECLPSEDEQAMTGSCPAECERIINATPGQYLVEVSASGLSCDSPGCSCTPNADGWCLLSNDLPALANDDALLLIIDYPSTRQATMVFD